MLSRKTVILLEEEDGQMAAEQFCLLSGDHCPTCPVLSG